MKLYLDNCCFNRPFDDQSQILIQLETQAVIAIQEKIIIGYYSLVWSYILSYENFQNPRDIPRREIFRWKNIATKPIIEESSELLEEAKNLTQIGVKSKDALHVASAVVGNCDYFISTDKKLLNKISYYNKIRTLDPISFIKEEYKDEK